MADAALTIQIPTFTDAWVQPSPTMPTVPLANCTPSQFGLTIINPGINGRITITQPTGSGSTYVPGSVTVTQGPSLAININVVSGPLSAPTTSYTECGLVLAWLSLTQGSNPTGPLRTGRDNFPTFFVTANGGLTVTDAALFGSNYEFMLLIQNSNGGVALVDPRITNSS